MFTRIYSRCILCLIVISFGCSKDDSPSTFQNPSTEQVMFIDEPIVLEKSDYILHTRVDSNIATFDIAGVPLVQKGTFNDIEISYSTPSSSDVDVLIYNQKKQEWDRLAYVISGGGLAIPGLHGHLLSSKGFKAREYIGIDSRLRVRFTSPGVYLKIRFLRLHEHYSATPLLIDKPNYSFGLTTDGDTYWTYSGTRKGFCRITKEGYIVNTVPSLQRYPQGLAFDGQYFWQADGSNRIYKVFLDGSVRDSFFVPTDYPGGLAHTGSALWLSEYQSTNKTVKVYDIDPVASCAGDSAVVLHTFSLPLAYTTGLTWDGSHLLISADSLYQVSTLGEIRRSWRLPVSVVGGIAVKGDIISIVSRGPLECRESDQVITRFKLR